MELLDALATYLEEEVGPELEGPLVYRTRVAMNLLTVVRRELSDEEALSREAVRLAALLDTPVPEGSPGRPRDAQHPASAAPAPGRRFGFR